MRSLRRAPAIGAGDYPTAIIEPLRRADSDSSPPFSTFPDRLLRCHILRSCLVLPSGRLRRGVGLRRRIECCGIAARPDRGDH
jgi:hypothetical protein